MADLADIEGIGPTYGEKLAGAGLGVGSEYADLLEAAGVDSVPELAQRNSANLAAALTAANEQKSLVRALPSESQVADWVEQAQGLEPAVHH